MSIVFFDSELDGSTALTNINPVAVTWDAVFARCSGYFRAKLFSVLIPQHFSKLAILQLPSYEDGTDRVFRKVGIQNSDAGELPRRKHTAFRRRRNFEIKKIS